MKAADIVESLWQDLSSEKFCIDSFADTLRAYFGYDGNGLSSSDIIKALNSDDNASWRDIAWACRECFVSFDSEKEESIECFVVYVAMTCLWADAIQRRQSQWDCSFDYVLKLAVLNLKKGDPYWRIRWFGFLFHRNTIGNLVEPTGDSG